MAQRSESKRYRPRSAFITLNTTYLHNATSSGKGPFNNTVTIISVPPKITTTTATTQNLHLHYTGAHAAKPKCLYRQSTHHHHHRLLPHRHTTWRRINRFLHYIVISFTVFTRSASTQNAQPKVEGISQAFLFYLNYRLGEGGLQYWDGLGFF